jgi:hypothetical protein
MNPLISDLLDKAAQSIKDAHDLACLVESGKAITDYLRLEHDLEIYRRDLEVGSS